MGWARAGLGKADVQVKIDAGFLSRIERERGYASRYHIGLGITKDRAAPGSSNLFENTAPAENFEDAAGDEEDKMIFGDFDLGTDA